jgi:hypothetical protein
MNKPYTMHEDFVLNRHYAKGGSLACIGLVKRSKGSIQHRAKLLGLKFTGKKRAGFRGFKVSPHAHPLVRRLLSHILQEGETQTRIAERAGLSRNCLKNWNSVNPSLLNFVAVANAAGLDVILQEVAA